MITDTLYIRLESGQQASWSLRQPSTGFGHVQRGTLDDALLLARNRRLVVILPSTDVTLTAVDLPAQLVTLPQAKLLQAVPYLLEDRLAEDVDTLHFALGRRDAQGRLAVAITAQEKMKEWLKPFHDRAIAPDLLVPDVLCLPLARETGPVWSILLENGHAVVRSDVSAGFSCETDMLPDLLAMDAPADLRVQIYPVEHAELPALACARQTAASVANGLEYLLRGLDELHAINLLQGDHAGTPDYLTWFKPWRVTAMLAAVLVGVALLGQAVEYLRLRNELRKLETTAETAFRAAFPQVVTVVDLHGQAQQQLAALKRAGGIGGFLPLLQGSSEVLGRVSGVQLHEVQFRDGALRLALVAGDTQSLDKLQEGFARQPGLRLEVESANATGQGVQIRAVVKAKS